jgi:hypothetical protein
MTKCIGAIGLFFVACLTSLAQERRAEVFFGYSYARINPHTSSQPSFNLNGGSAAFAYDLSEPISFVVDLGGYHIAKIGDANADVDFFSFLFGPRFSYRAHSRIIPYGQVLIGGVSTSLYGAPPGAFVGRRAGGFAMTLGGGVDTKMSERLAFRLIQGEYFMTLFHEFSASPGSPLSSFPGVVAAAGRVTQNNLGVSTGIVLRF